MTDVRKRTHVWTRYEVWQDTSLVVVFTSMSEARGYCEDFASLRIVPVSRYKLERRPVVRESRVPLVTLYRASDEIVAEVSIGGSRFAAWERLWSTGRRLIARERTRAAAERACRKHLRAIGYRVVRKEK